MILKETKTLCRQWSTEHAGLFVPGGKLQCQILEEVELRSGSAECGECEVRGAEGKRELCLQLYYLLTKSDILMLLYQLAV